MGIYTPFFICLAHPHEGQKAFGTLYLKQMTCDFFFQVSLSHGTRSIVPTLSSANGTYSAK